LKVLVKNRHTTTALEQYDVVEIKDTIIDYSQEPDEFKRTPNLTAYYSQYPTNTNLAFYGVLLEPLEGNGYAYAAITGLVPVRIDVTDANHKYADIIDPGYTTSPGYLRSKASGPFSIFWKETGAGVKWAYVALPPIGNWLSMIGSTGGSSYDLRGQGWREIEFVPGSFICKRNTTYQQTFQVQINRTSTATANWMGL
jgi:hypothetical protein